MNPESHASARSPRGTSNSALLVMDLMAGTVGAYPDHEALLDRVAASAEAARAAGVPVVHVRLGFRPGHPEVDRTNAVFGPVADAGRMLADDPSSHLHAAVAPHDGDVVVVKKRLSAFVGSDLDLVLRASGTSTVVLTGVRTSGVVLATLLDACDRDYHCVVLEDGCADQDPEVHRVLTENVFRAFGTVTSTASWIASIE